METLAMILGALASGTSIAATLSGLFSGNQQQELLEQQTKDNAEISSAQAEVSIEELQKNQELLDLVNKPLSEEKAAELADLYRQYGIEAPVAGKSILEQAFATEVSKQNLKIQGNRDQIEILDRQLAAGGLIDMQEAALEAENQALVAGQETANAQNILAGKQSYRKAMDAIGAANVLAAARGHAAGAGSSAGSIAAETQSDAADEFGSSLELDTMSGLFGKAFGATLLDQAAKRQDMTVRTEALSLSRLDAQQKQELAVQQDTIYAQELTDMVNEQFATVNQIAAQEDINEKAIAALQKAKEIYDRIASGGSASKPDPSSTGGSGDEDRRGHAGDRGDVPEPDAGPPDASPSSVAGSAGSTSRRKPIRTEAVAL